MLLDHGIKISDGGVGGGGGGGGNGVLKLDASRPEKKLFCLAQIDEVVFIKTT